MYRVPNLHDGNELYNLSYEEKIATLQKSKLAMEKDFFTQKALAERLQLELGKVQKQFGLSMTEIEEVVNRKWQGIVAEKDTKIHEMNKELKMEKYAAMLRKREAESKSEGLVPGSRKFDMEVEKVMTNIMNIWLANISYLGSTRFDKRVKAKGSIASASCKHSDGRKEEAQITNGAI